MADLSKIKLNGVEYELKDATARDNIPTKLSALTNDSGFQTATQVNSAITSALGDITEFSISVIDTLPAEGENGVFYFVPNSGSDNNIYDEYVWVNNTFEKIGTTEIDLSNYLQTSDIADWAKAATKPLYTAAEVGALPDTTSIPDAVSISNTLTEGTLIATINGTNIYAPAYTDADEVSY